MAKVDVSESSALTPDQAWALASDLGRFEEWLTIFGGWRGPVPTTVEKGTKVSSLIKVKGFRNVIHWEVTRCDEPQRIQLRGSGRGGVEIEMDMRVIDNKPGSTFQLVADLRGSVLNGPVGRLVAKVLTSDVRNSVRNLAALTPAVS
jgi:hypothetical protein